MVADGIRDEARSFLFGNDVPDSLPSKAGDHSGVRDVRVCRWDGGPIFSNLVYEGTEFLPFHRGGTSELYLVREQSMDELRVLKVLTELPEDRESWEIEWRMMMDISRCEAFRIPTVHSVGIFEERPCIILSYIHGPTISDCIEEIGNPACTPKATRRQVIHTISLLIEDVCDTLARINRDRTPALVHGDIKPGNLIVRAEGASVLAEAPSADRVWILDFGEARYVGQSLGGFTPEYASPEQLRAEPVQPGGNFSLVTPRSDQYQLGAILLDLLEAYRKRFPSGRGLGMWLGYCFDTRYRKLQRIAETMTCRDPARRYGSFGQIVGELSASCKWFTMRGLRAAAPVGFLLVALGSVGVVGLKSHQEAVRELGGVSQKYHDTLSALSRVSADHDRTIAAMHEGQARFAEERGGLERTVRGLQTELEIQEKRSSIEIELLRRNLLAAEESLRSKQLAQEPSPPEVSEVIYEDLDVDARFRERMAGWLREDGGGLREVRLDIETYRAADRVRYGEAASNTLARRVEEAFEDVSDKLWRVRVFGVAADGDRPLRISMTVGREAVWNQVQLRRPEGQYWILPRGVATSFSWAPGAPVSITVEERRSRLLLGSSWETVSAEHFTGPLALLKAFGVPSLAWAGNERVDPKTTANVDGIKTIIRLEAVERLAED